MDPMNLRPIDVDAIDSPHHAIVAYKSVCYNINEIEQRIDEAEAALREAVNLSGGRIAPSHVLEIITTLGKVDDLLMEQGRARHAIEEMLGSFGLNRLVGLIQAPPPETG